MMPGQAYGAQEKIVMVDKRTGARFGVEMSQPRKFAIMSEKMRRDAAALTLLGRARSDERSSHNEPYVIDSRTGRRSWSA